MFVLGCNLFGFFGLGCSFCLGGVSGGELAAEAVDTAGRVHQLLLAGEERVAREQISTTMSPLCVELVLKCSHRRTLRWSLRSWGEFLS